MQARRRDVQTDVLLPAVLHQAGDRHQQEISMRNLHEWRGWLLPKEVQELGWVNPKDTDENSTNCLLNSFAIEVHMQQYGFHPYAFEIAGLVREGYITREDGLKKLSTPSDPKIIEYVKQKLGLSD